MDIVFQLVEDVVQRCGRGDLSGCFQTVALAADLPDGGLIVLGGGVRLQQQRIDALGQQGMRACEFAQIAQDTALAEALTGLDVLLCIHI